MPGHFVNDTTRTSLLPTQCAGILQYIPLGLSVQVNSILSISHLIRLILTNWSISTRHTLTMFWVLIRWENWLELQIWLLPPDFSTTQCTKSMKNIWRWAIRILDSHVIFPPPCLKSGASNPVHARAPKEPAAWPWPVRAYSQELRRSSWDLDVCSYTYAGSEGAPWMRQHPPGPKGPTPLPVRAASF